MNTSSGTDESLSEGTRSLHRWVNNFTQLLDGKDASHLGIKKYEQIVKRCLMLRLFAALFRSINLLIRYRRR